MMQGEHASDRTVLQISGADRHEFLQGLVTNDLNRPGGGLIYAAMLNPQGKYLADFFLLRRDDDILLDVKSDFAEGLAQRLGMYRLRADVAITPADLHVQRGLGKPPPGGFSDPRDATLGWRLYAPEKGGEAMTDWDAIRVAGCIPETGIELIPDESYILECGFERLSGVDFRKGCYVGQEVTARMKHKTELRKGLALVALDGVVPVGTDVLAGGKPAGTVFTQSGGRGIAYLRFDRAEGEMMAGDVALRRAD